MKKNTRGADDGRASRIIFLVIKSMMRKREEVTGKVQILGEVHRCRFGGIHPYEIPHLATEKQQGCQCLWPFQARRWEVVSKM